MCIRDRGYAVRHHIFDFGMFFRMMQAFLFGLPNDGPGDGMREMLLKTGRRPQDVVPLVAFAGDHLRNARTGFRKGPGLVEDHGVSRRQRFEEPPALDEDAATYRCV